MERLLIACGAVAAALAVMLGAAGTHAFAGLDSIARGRFETALAWHGWNAVGVILSGVLLRTDPGNRWFAIGGGALALGLALFAGSLYALALTGHEALRVITPFGGTLLILGWLTLAPGALAQRR